MKRILSALLFLACSAANAQFVTGQILTAAQLNAAFANVLATSGGTLTGPLTVQGNTTVNNLTVNGTFTAPGALSPSSLSPQIPNSVIGNVSNNTQSPGVVGLPSCASNTNALIYTNGAGFTCNTNINASTLGGQIFAAPGPIGSSVASTGSFTTLSASGTVSGAGFTSLLSPYLTTATAASTYATIAQATTALAATGGSINGVTVGATTPSTGAFTTLNASGNDALFYQTTNAQSFTSATPATVTTWTKVFDRVNANFNASTGIFTAPVTGIYHVAASLNFSANTGAIGTVCQTIIVANGVTEAVGAFIRQTATSTPMVCSAAIDVSLTAGQTIVVQGLQNTGSAVTLNGGAIQNYLSIHRVP